MIGIGEAGPEAIVFYAVALPALAGLGWMLDAALSKWRYLMPKGLREALMYPCDGDRAWCPDCGSVEGVAETWPWPMLTCGDCGRVLEEEC